MAETLEATYRIVTPMFLGNAEQKCGDGIRPPSFKGALRFWWRALEWSRVLLENRGQETAALHQLHEEEGELFGLAADQEHSRQSRFMLRIVQDCKTLTSQQLPRATSGHQYLLGQGLHHFRDGYLRPAIAPGEFRVRLVMRPDTDLQQRESLARAFLLLGLLGGLGSRARKGFGALSIQTLEGSTLAVPRNPDEIRTCLLSLTAGRLDIQPPFTAFSGATRIDLVPHHGNDPWDLLNEMGSQMQMYRSWGQNGKVGNLQAERNFPQDHDLAFEVANGQSVNQHPQRTVFGLPHNYFFSSTKGKAEVNAIAPKKEGGWSDLGSNRRASPLFLHPHVFPDHSVVGLISLFPAQFLPDAWKIGIGAGGKGRGPVSRVDVHPDWTVLHTFMDRFADRSCLLEART